MTKKKVVKPQREFTRRQLSRWQQEKRRQRIILGIGLFIIAAAFVIVATGWYISQYRPQHQTVIRVNDTELDMNYFIKALGYYGARSPGGVTFAMTDEVAKIIERNELVRQGAIDLEISISKGEVDDELESRNPPLGKEYRDLVRTEMLITKLEEEYFDAMVPASGEQRHIMAILLENERLANKAKGSLEAGGDFASLPEELSVEIISRVKESDFGWLPRGVLTELLDSSVLEDAAFSSEVGVLSQPIFDAAVNKAVGYWLIKVLEREDDLEMAHVQVILLGSEEKATNIKDRLAEGEEFAALAKEFSEEDFSRENDGDVGWVEKNIMSTPFQNFIFSAQLEAVSRPIRDEAVFTKGGYWLFRVVDKDDNRKIEGENRSILRRQAFKEWFSAIEDDPANKIGTFLDDARKVWAMEQAMKDIIAESGE